MATSSETEIQTLIGQAMGLHAADSAGAAVLLQRAAAQLGPGRSTLAETLCRDAEHVLLGHLADLPALQALLDGLGDGAAPRTRCAMALARGELDEAGSDWQVLAAADRVRAHYNAALAATRSRDFDAARRLMQQAQACVNGADQASARAWAATANNIAADLRHYHRGGDAPSAQLMLEAAQSALDAWRVAGGWLEVERAHWQLAMCAAAAGEGALALAAARQSLQDCEAQAADDYEHCFAHQAMALAAIAAGDRALAQAQREAMALRSSRLPAGGDQDYAQRCLAEIDTALAALQRF